MNLYAFFRYACLNIYFAKKENRVAYYTKAEVKLKGINKVLGKIHQNADKLIVQVGFNQVVPN